MPGSFRPNLWVSSFIIDIFQLFTYPDRKRAPLPPQCMHFREVSKSSGRGKADIIPSEATAAAYHGPSPIATSNANTHSSPVSAHGSGLPPFRGHGDRDRGLVRDLPPHQMQTLPLPQNQNQSQHSRASKFGPPVSSSSSQKVEHDVPPHYDQQVRDGRRDRDRDRDRERDTRDEGRERGRGRDRDRGERRDKRRERDVSAADEPSSPATSSSLRHPPPSQSLIRPPSAPLHGDAVATFNRNRSRSVSADPSIRAGSGMYADREPVPVGISMPVQDVPLSMPAPAPTHTSASAPKGPRAHGHGPTSPSTNMYPPRRGRSPSHMSMVPHRDDRYDQPPPQMRDGPRSWKEEMMVERGGHRVCLLYILLFTNALTADAFSRAAVVVVEWAEVVRLFLFLERTIFLLELDMDMDPGQHRTIITKCGLLLQGLVV